MAEILISSNSSMGPSFVPSFWKFRFFLSKIPAPQTAADKTKTTSLEKNFFVVILRVFFLTPKKQPHNSEVLWGSPESAIYLTTWQNIHSFFNFNLSVASFVCFREGSGIWKLFFCWRDLIFTSLTVSWLIRPLNRLKFTKDGSCLSIFSVFLPKLCRLRKAKWAYIPWQMPWTVFARLGRVSLVGGGIWTQMTDLHPRKLTNG